MVVRADGQVIEVRPEQFWKQPAGNDVISSGRVTDDRAEQPVKADWPTDTPLERIAEVSAVQPEKAFEPKETPLPTVTAVKAVHPE